MTIILILRTVICRRTGVYTDTDTACVRSLKDWPGLYTSSPGFRTLNDPFLATTPLIFRIAAGETVDEVLKEYEEPSLVIAFEHDQWVQDKDWRELGHARGMQFVQVSRVRLCVIATWLETK